MKVVINGVPRELTPGINVKSFVDSFEKLDPEHIVVELNGKVLKKSEWENTILNENDIIEVVEFVGGG